MENVLTSGAAQTLQPTSDERQGACTRVSQVSQAGQSPQASEVPQVTESATTDVQAPDLDSQAPVEEDPETAAAARSLFEGRLGYRFLKRFFDIVFSMLVLVLLSWLFAIVAIAIKVDDPKGPAFFKQRRVGLNGVPFVMYKFRSMYADAEDRLEALYSLNEKDGPVFKIKNDPRVTRVGRFIRKTSIDELPQFINVLKGDMSVVGPRPALPREVAQYTPRQRQRLLVKPGITCFWQTRRNRDDISFDEWVDLDLLYIRKMSVWTDIKQIIETVGVVLTAQGN